MAASLDPLNPQSRHAPMLLAMFREVLKERAYTVRLACHYRMFKETLRTSAS